MCASKRQISGREHDLSEQATRDPRLSSDTELVRLVAKGHDSDATDEKRQAAAAWQELVVRNFDRVHALVAVWRHPSVPDVRIPIDERDDVVQKAFARILEGLFRNFEGGTIPKFVAALTTCVDFACRDHARKSMREEMRSAGSIDETAPKLESDEVGRFDRELAELGKRIEEGRFDARLELEAVAKAIDELPNEDQRAVIRLTWEGHSSKDIAARLGHSVANVDQLRSRGLRRLDGTLGEGDER
jgi:RNA polymerase sigma factor (sigma-70 family)